MLSHVWLFVTPWNSLGQNTGVGNLSLLQGIFPTQVLNPGLPHCRRILYHLSHKGTPRILEWVAYPFLVDLPDPGIELGPPALTGRFLTNWDIREALKEHYISNLLASDLGKIYNCIKHCVSVCNTCVLMCLYIERMIKQIEMEKHKQILNLSKNV